MPKSIQEAKTSRRNCLAKTTKNSTKSRNEVPTFLFMCALAGVTFVETNQIPLRNTTLPISGFL